MSTYGPAVVANVVCVLFLVPLLCQTRGGVWRRAIVLLPLCHVVVCTVAGVVGLLWGLTGTDEPMYSDVCPPLLPNPIAVYLFHARWWGELAPDAVAGRVVHFVVLTSLLGLFVGAVSWGLIGWVWDGVVSRLRVSGAEDQAPACMRARRPGGAALVATCAHVTCATSAGEPATCTVTA